jgi:hypothetical protein
MHMHPGLVETSGRLQNDHKEQKMDGRLFLGLYPDASYHLLLSGLLDSPRGLENDSWPPMN